MESSYTSQSDNFPQKPPGFCRLSIFFGILLPYFPPPMRHPLLLFSKIYECMECFRHGKRLCSHCPDYSRANSQEKLSDIISRLSPFLDEQERSQLSQMQNMMQMMNLYQTFQDLAPFMAQAFSSDAASHPSSDAAAEPGGSRPDPAGALFHTAFEADGRSENKKKADEGANANADFSPFSNANTDMLFSMLSPEQQELFQNIQSIMASDGGNNPEFEDQNPQNRKSRHNAADYAEGLADATAEPGMPAKPNE